MFQRVQVPSSGTVGAPRHTELWTLLSCQVVRFQLPKPLATRAEFVAPR